MVWPQQRPMGGLPFYGERRNEGSDSCFNGVYLFDTCLTQGWLPQYLYNTCHCCNQASLCVSCISIIFKMLYYIICIYGCARSRFISLYHLDRVARPSRTNIHQPLFFMDAQAWCDSWKRPAIGISASQGGSPAHVESMWESIFNQCAQQLALRRSLTRAAVSVHDGSARSIMPITRTVM